MNGTMPDRNDRAILESARRSAVERVRTVRAELDGLAGDAEDANGDDEHDPEGSTLAYERARVAALLAEAESNLDDLDRALVKVASGNYAVCEHCGAEIGTERLEALPATRTCIACAAAPPPR